MNFTEELVAEGCLELVIAGELAHELQTEVKSLCVNFDG